MLDSQMLDMQPVSLSLPVVSASVGFRLVAWLRWQGLTGCRW